MKNVTVAPAVLTPAQIDVDRKTRMARIRTIASTGVMHMNAFITNRGQTTSSVDMDIVKRLLTRFEHLPIAFSDFAAAADEDCLYDRVVSIESFMTRHWSDVRNIGISEIVKIDNDMRTICTMVYNPQYGVVAPPKKTGFFSLAK